MAYGLASCLNIYFCARHIACLNFPVQVGLVMEYDAVTFKLNRTLKSHLVLFLSVLYWNVEISMADFGAVY